MKEEELRDGSKMRGKQIKEKVEMEEFRKGDWKKTEERTERREFPVEMRVTRQEGQPTLITGHAAVFDQTTTLWPGVKEKVAPGAFVDSIGKDDIRALFNHDPNFVLGRTKSGTLSLREDTAGLYYENKAPDNQLIRDMVISPIERGDISQNSFAFSVPKGGDDWDEEPDGTLVRTLKRVKLYDISPVTYPAYPTTDIKLRSKEELLAEAGHRLAAKGRSIKLALRKLELEEKSS